MPWRASRLRDVPVTQREGPGTGALESELEVTRAESANAIRNLELSNEEQKAINEEALSIQEEYQSTNEELVTSKEELQSLNEELTALNSQLHETLERQRTTSNDLQNVLFSTDVATIFLDAKLNIRFFTPATRLLFSILPSDVGRPLAGPQFAGRRWRSAERRANGAADRCAAGTRDRSTHRLVVHPADFAIPHAGRPG